MTATTGTTLAPSLEHVRRIAAEIARPSAHDVDDEGRLPRESLHALRDERLLSVSLDHGERPAWPVADLVEGGRILGSACSSTGMIWAMHHSQQMILARHGGSSPALEGLRKRAAANETLIASAASEGSADLLSSSADASAESEELLVEKRASAVSYGDAADAYLLSFRRPGSTKASDVLLAFVSRDQCAVTSEGEWDAMGMRGTASGPMHLAARFHRDQVFSEPFETIHVVTGVPAAHLLWAGCWLGIAESALETARQALRRSHRGAGSALTDFSRVSGVLDGLRSIVCEGIDRYDQGAAVMTSDSGLADAAWFNGLKIAASTDAVSVVLASLRVIGVAGYLEQGPSTVARQLRDILSSELMVNNHRLVDTNATLQLVRPGGRQ